MYVTISRTCTLLLIEYYVTINRKCMLLLIECYYYY